MRIQLKFKQPNHISLSEADEVKIVFSNTTFLLDEDEQMLETGTELVKRIPA